MKVYGIHTITLRPEMSAEEFEQRMHEYLATHPELPGVHDYLLKGEYGQHVGEYLLLVEVDSLEQRNFFFPPDGKYTPEALAWAEAHPEALAFEEYRQQLIARLAGYDITDYIVIDEQSPRSEPKYCCETP